MYQLVKVLVELYCVTSGAD